MKAVIYTRASLDATGRTKAGRRPTTLLGGGLARCGTCGGARARVVKPRRDALHVLLRKDVDRV